MTCMAINDTILLVFSIVFTFFAAFDYRFNRQLDKFEFEWGTMQNLF